MVFANRILTYIANLIGENYLAEPLDWEQVEYNTSGIIVRDLYYDIEKLNGLLLSNSIPLRFSLFYIGSCQISFDLKLKIDTIQIEIQSLPKSSDSNKNDHVHFGSVLSNVTVMAFRAAECAQKLNNNFSSSPNQSEYGDNDENLKFLETLSDIACSMKDKNEKLVDSGSIGGFAYIINRLLGRAEVVLKNIMIRFDVPIRLPGVQKAVGFNIHLSELSMMNDRKAASDELKREEGGSVKSENKRSSWFSYLNIFSQKHQDNYPESSEKSFRMEKILKIVNLVIRWDLWSTKSDLVNNTPEIVQPSPENIIASCQILSIPGCNNTIKLSLFVPNVFDHLNDRSIESQDIVDLSLDLNFEAFIACLSPSQLYWISLVMYQIISDYETGNVQCQHADFPCSGRRNSISSSEEEEHFEDVLMDDVDLKMTETAMYRSCISDQETIHQVKHQFSRISLNWSVGFISFVFLLDDEMTLRKFNDAHTPKASSSEQDGVNEMDQSQLYASDCGTLIAMRSFFLRLHGKMPRKCWSIDADDSRKMVETTEALAFNLATAKRGDIPSLLSEISLDMLLLLQSKDHLLFTFGLWEGNVIMNKSNFQVNTTLAGVEVNECVYPVSDSKNSICVKKLLQITNSLNGEKCERENIFQVEMDLRHGSKLSMAFGFIDVSLDVTSTDRYFRLIDAISASHSVSHSYNNFKHESPSVSPQIIHEDQLYTNCDQQRPASYHKERLYLFDENVPKAAGASNDLSLECRIRGLVTRLYIPIPIESIEKNCNQLDRERKHFYALCSSEKITQPISQDVYDSSRFFHWWRPQLRSEYFHFIFEDLNLSATNKAVHENCDENNSVQVTFAAFQGLACEDESTHYPFLIIPAKGSPSCLKLSINPLVNRELYNAQERSANKANSFNNDENVTTNLLMSALGPRHEVNGPPFLVSSQFIEDTNGKYEDRRVYETLKRDHLKEHHQESLKFARISCHLEIPEVIVSLANEKCTHLLVTSLLYDLNLWKSQLPSGRFNRSKLRRPLQSIPDVEEILLNPANYHSQHLSWFLTDIADRQDVCIDLNVHDSGDLTDSPPRNSLDSGENPSLMNLIKTHYTSSQFFLHLEVKTFKIFIDAPNVDDFPNAYLAPKSVIFCLSGMILGVEALDDVSNEQIVYTSLDIEKVESSLSAVMSRSGETLSKTHWPVISSNDYTKILFSTSESDEQTSDSMFSFAMKYSTSACEEMSQGIFTLTMNKFLINHWPTLDKIFENSLRPEEQFHKIAYLNIINQVLNVNIDTDVEYPGLVVKPMSIDLQIKVEKSCFTWSAQRNVVSHYPIEEAPNVRDSLRELRILFSLEKFSLQVRKDSQGNISLVILLDEAKGHLTNLSNFSHQSWHGMCDILLKTKNFSNEQSRVQHNPPLALIAYYNWLNELCMAEEVKQVVGNFFSATFASMDHLEIRSFSSNCDLENVEAKRFDIRITNNSLVLATCSDTLAVLQMVFAAFTQTSPAIGRTEKTSRGDTSQEDDTDPGTVHAIAKNDLEIREELLRDAMTEEEESYIRVSQNQSESSEDDSLVNVLSMPDGFIFSDEKIHDVQEVKTSLQDFDLLSCRVLSGDYFKMKKNFFPSITPSSSPHDHSANLMDRNKTLFLDPPSIYNKSISSITLYDFEVSWKFYAGSDLCLETIEDSKQSYDDLAKRTFKTPKAQRFGESLFRNYNQKVNLKLSKIYFRTAQFAKGYGYSDSKLNALNLERDTDGINGEPSMRNILRIGSILIQDQLPNSNVNYAFFSNNSFPVTQEASVPFNPASPLLRISVIYVRVISSNPVLKRKVDPLEIEINVSIQPLRINLDQNLIIFLSQFQEIFLESQNILKNFFPHEPSPNVPLLDDSSSSDNSSSNDRDTREVSPLEMDDVTYETPFIRSLTISQDVFIIFDYHGRTLDTTSGAIYGILLLLAQINNASIRFKKIKFDRGYPVLEHLFDDLLIYVKETISKNFPNLITSYGPIQEFSQICTSVYALFSKPIKSIWALGPSLGIRARPKHQLHCPKYFDAGQDPESVCTCQNPIEATGSDILFGISSASRSFSTSSTFAIVQLSITGIKALQSLAETAHAIVTPDTSLYSRSDMSHQPNDICEGITMAKKTFIKGINLSGNKIYKAALNNERYQTANQNRLIQSVGGVLRQLPSALTTQLVTGFEGSAQILRGVRNQVKPEAKLEEDLKWKSNN